MKKISKLLSRKILTLFGTGAILFAPILVLADDYGLSKTANAAGLAGNSDLTALVGNIIGSALSLVGVVFFILMVYGGFLWMTARGKEDIVNKAKDTIIAAVIGLIIVFASYALTSFIFSSLDGRTGGGGNNDDPFGPLPDFQGECMVPDECALGETCAQEFCVAVNISMSGVGYCESGTAETLAVCSSRGESWGGGPCISTQVCALNNDKCSSDYDSGYVCK